MNSNDLSDIYEYLTQLDMEQYTQYLEYFKQYEAMEEDEAESSIKYTRRYIARDRKLAEDNMILEDQKFDISEYWSMYASPEGNIRCTWVERYERQRMKNKELRDRRAYEDLRQDIMDHLWNLNDGI
nr:hypothetical protein [Tanacetum cinerariifolium]